MRHPAQNIRRDVTGILFATLGFALAGAVFLAGLAYWWRS
jgi:hypothetical protein